MIFPDCDTDSGQRPWSILSAATTALRHSISTHLAVVLNELSYMNICDGEDGEISSFERAVSRCQEINRLLKEVTTHLQPAAAGFPVSELDTLFSSLGVRSSGRSEALHGTIAIAKETFRRGISELCTTLERVAAGVAVSFEGADNMRSTALNFTAGKLDSAHTPVTVDSLTQFFFAIGVRKIEFPIFDAALWAAGGGLCVKYGEDLLAIRVDCPLLANLSRGLNG